MLLNPKKNKMRKIVALLGVVLLLTGCLRNADEPGIYNKKDWEAFVATINAGEAPTAWQDADGVVRLRGDLNLKRWKNPRPAGTNKMPFEGVFDGGMYTISGLRMIGEEPCMGLFGVNRGTIRRLHLKANCRLENSAEEGITGSVCGVNYGRIEHCESAAEVIGAGVVGGIVGRIQSDPASAVVPLVSRCTNRGKVRCTGVSAGGVVGWSSRAKVVDSKNLGAVVCSGSYAGGVVGLNSGLVRGCENQAPVRGRDYAGGVAGANRAPGELQEVGNSAPVQAETIGDIVGEDFARSYVDEDILYKYYQHVEL